MSKIISYKNGKFKYNINKLNKIISSVLEEGKI